MPVGVRLRPRTRADIPRLVALLTEQQPRSGYPIVWPLPFPVEDFIVREHELGAWVAETDGVVLGHVCVQRVAQGVGPKGGTDPGPVPLWCAAHDCEAAELAAVSALFVGLEARGTGVGAALLQHAVNDITARGLRPCLDVQARSATVRAIYAHLGWEEVGGFRPHWLPADQDDEVACVLRDPSDHPTRPGRSSQPAGERPPNPTGAHR